MLHLLLIEDNPADVMMIREALRGSPIAADVTIAYDGEQALRLLEVGPKSDFVILDLSIPKGMGTRSWSATRHQLRRLRWWYSRVPRMEKTNCVRWRPAPVIMSLSRLGSPHSCTLSRAS